ncbi:hypothetical protein [Mesorhizobium sp. LjNodule214]|uniref:hypothetical protein n=1 Tax=Mesorhizobium sp. LjNodule214 TaxID=3342252 RepID=UPI003ECED8C5
MNTLLKAMGDNRENMVVICARLSIVLVAVINGETSLNLFRRGNPSSLTCANKDVPAFPMDEVA